MPQMTATSLLDTAVSFFGRRREPAQENRTTPAMSRGMPMGVTEKRPKGSSPACLSRSFTTIRGPDAIMVTVPPRMAANPMGIIRRERGIAVCFPILLMAGRKRAAAPTFWITEDMRPTVRETVAMILDSFFPA